MLRAILLALGLWVVAGHTYGEFTRVRDVVVRTGVVAQPAASVPLAGAAAIREPYVVLMFRARNDAAAPLTVTVTAGGQELTRSTIAPRSSQRVDLSWPRMQLATAREIELRGDQPGWTLEAAEIANVHGFTRGALDFIILPDQQPFRGAPLWVWFAGLFCAALAYAYGPARWSQWPGIVHRVCAGAIVLLFAAAAASPHVSSFRIVLAAHTVAAGLAILAAWGIHRLIAAIVPPVAVAAQRGVRSAIRWVETVLRPAIERTISIAARAPWFKVAMLAGVVTYAAILWPNIGAFAGGADSSGYLGSARLLLEGRARTSIRALPGAPAGSVRPEVYTPLGFRSVGSTEAAPSYPVGLPLLIAAAPAVDLDTKAAITMAAHAVAGALLVFWLALECGLSRYAAALAALLLASSPVYLFMSLTLMSDVPALVWTTAAVTAMWRSRKHSDGWALAAGAAISLAVLIRPTNALGFAPLAVCAGLSARRWLLLGAGGAPGAVLFCAYNLAAYSAAVATGYVGMEVQFDTKHILPSLQHYAEWLPAMLTPIGALALLLPALFRTRRPLAAVLMLWSAVYLGFYSIYSYTNDAWWYTRFLLPAFPALIVGTLLVGRAALDRFKDVAASGFVRVVSRIPTAVVAMAIGATIVAHNARWVERLGVIVPSPHESQYMAVARWVRAHLPPGSGIVSMQMSGSLYHYTGFSILRWEFIGPEILRSLEHDSTAGRHPLYAVLHPLDFELEVRRQLPGRWKQLATIEGITVWRFDGLEGAESLPPEERWVPLNSDSVDQGSSEGTGSDPDKL